MRKLSNFFDVSQLEVAPEEPNRKKVKITKKQVEQFKEKKKHQKVTRMIKRLVIFSRLVCLKPFSYFLSLRFVPSVSLLFSLPYLLFYTR